MTAISELRDRSADALGPLVASRRPRTSAILNSVDIWSGCSLVMFGALLVGLAAGGLAAVLGAKGTLGNILLGVTAILIVAMIVALIRWARRFARVVVDHHEGGIVVTRNGHRDVLRWDDIEALRWVAVHIHGAGALGSSIRTTDGREIGLPSILPGAVEIGGVVEHEVAIRHLPAAMAAFQAGRTVAFGVRSGPEPAISRTGITVGGQSLAWEDVISVAIQSGYEPELVVSWRGGRFRNESKVPLSAIDNAAVLMTIVRTIPGVEAG